jgi:hypothetical protein
VPDLLGDGRAFGCELTEARQTQAHLRVIRSLLLRCRKGDAPATAFVVGVGIGEPVTEQRTGTGLELLA